MTASIHFFAIFAYTKDRNEFIDLIGGAIMKQTQEKFEAMNLEYENLYNEEDDRRDYNSVWYS